MLAIIFDSVGFGEWFVLLAVVLVFVGPKKLPSAARTIGNYYSRFRRAADSFKRQLMDMETEFSKAAEEAQRGAEDAFKIEGDEASAVPASTYDYDPGFPDNPDEPAPPAPPVPPVPPVPPATPVPPAAPVPPAPPAPEV